jgi:hypothetical protein
MTINSPSIATEDMPMAEGNALRYMIALFSADMNEVLSTIHPDAIDEVYSDLMSELKQAEKENRQYSFLASAGIFISPEELMAMTKNDVFKLVVNLNSDQPEQDHMKKVNFKILGSNLVDNETLIVSMVMGKSKPNNPFKLEMKRKNKEWLVIRSFVEDSQTSI